MSDPGQAIDLGATLRALRRAADLSQRELAARSGVPQATLARIESGRSTGPNFRTVERLVAAAAGRITIAGRPAGPGDATGAATGAATAAGVLTAVPQQGLRDAAGRHCPAHLDAREVREPKDWPGAWWAHWSSLGSGYRTPLPAVTYRIDRDRRDRDRHREWVRREHRVRRHLHPVLPTTSWRFVAELPDGTLVGELHAHEPGDGSFEADPSPDGCQIVVDGLRVAPAYRLLGIGRALVAALTAEMARRDVRSARVVAEGEGARFLWLCGFEVESWSAAVMRFERPVSGARPRRW
ncbi:GNAT family N-acetyltransferase [Micromonospora sp. WMMA2032]|uniref:GNAT family N-acetyltransferase n=1 Tax=Micromonospora sp. WMMA2032 TaxID=2039870 RepID=UPI0020A34775|nr:GNAT family N-acetyltransferase [Micromonospora sp. WMMA2032]